MKIYQLRLDRDQSLADISEAITCHMARILSSEPAFNAHRERLYAPLGAAVHKILGQYFQTYDTCGCGSICDLGLRTTSWHNQEEGHPLDHVVSGPVKRLILGPGLDLEGLLHDMKGAIGRVMTRLINETWPIQKFEQDLVNTIKASLGRYVYESPVCGRAEICHHRHHLDPWKAQAI